VTVEIDKIKERIALSRSNTMAGVEAMAALVYEDVDALIGRISALEQQVTDCQRNNNEELERRRAAEARLEAAEDLLASLKFAVEQGATVLEMSGHYSEETGDTLEEQIRKATGLPLNG